MSRNAPPRSRYVAVLVPSQSFDWWQAATPGLGTACAHPCIRPTLSEACARRAAAGGAAPAAACTRYILQRVCTHCALCRPGSRGGERDSACTLEPTCTLRCTRAAGRWGPGVRHHQSGQGEMQCENAGSAVERTTADI